MSRLVNGLEALLFSSGRRMGVAELGSLLNAKESEVLKALQQLQETYRQRETALFLSEEGGHWKLSVKEEFMPLVRKIVAETELPKGVMETLALIAWKSPILQSDVIKIRNNKAYEHIALLEESGFIAKEKHGRSFKLKLTPKFSEYFDVESIEKLKRQLSPAKTNGGIQAQSEQKNDVAEMKNTSPGEVNESGSVPQPKD